MPTWENMGGHRHLSTDKSFLIGSELRLWYEFVAQAMDKVNPHAIERGS